MEALLWAEERPVDPADAREGILKEKAELARRYAEELKIPIARPDTNSLSEDDRAVLRQLGLEGVGAKEMERHQKEEEAVATAKQIAHIPPEEFAIMKRLGIPPEVWIRHA